MIKNEMNFEKIINLLEEQFGKNNKVFFSYAWRENLNEYLKEESKYIKLTQWIDKEIQQNQDVINIFNPADKYEGYTKEYFKNYKNACSTIAMLLNFKDILLDNKTTKKMRENIEYTISKVWKVKYSSFLKKYL